MRSYLLDTILRQLDVAQHALRENSRAPLTAPPPLPDYDKPGPSVIDIF